MKIIAALVIGFYVMLVIGIFIHLISQWGGERKPYKDRRFVSREY